MKNSVNTQLTNSETKIKPKYFRTGIVAKTAKLHGQIKIKGTTLNMDLKQIRLNADMVSNFGGDTYHYYEDKEHSFSYHVKPANLKNHVRVELHTEEWIKYDIFHKTECREIKAYIDNFLIAEIRHRQLK